MKSHLNSYPDVSFQVLIFYDILVFIVPLGFIKIAFTFPCSILQYSELSGTVLSIFNFTNLIFAIDLTFKANLISWMPTINSWRIIKEAKQKKIAK